MKQTENRLLQQKYSRKAGEESKRTKGIRREEEVRGLSLLVPGEEAVLMQIPSSHPLWQRLTDWGFTRGTHIACLYAGPLGDPTAYRIHGGVVALRRQDAEKIPVVFEREREGAVGGRTVRRWSKLGRNILGKEECGNATGEFADGGERL